MVSNVIIPEKNTFLGIVKTVLKHVYKYVTHLFRVFRDYSGELNHTLRLNLFSISKHIQI